MSFRVLETRSSDGHSILLLQGMKRGPARQAGPTSSPLSETNMDQPQPPAPVKRPPRILSGVQPSGKLHLGSYFGAVKRHIEMQTQGQCFFFIANYHAMTTI